MSDIDPPTASTSKRQQLTQPTNDSTDFPLATQRQILRSQQRDASQIRRLVDLASELIRSLAGTRWLAHRQTIVNITVKAVYLLLTFGRGLPTMGEEYTDMTPRGTPSRLRRLVAITLLVSTAPSPAFFRARGYDRMARVLESPFAQSLPELHMIAFLYGGRFLELGRRLTGLTFLSTQVRPQKPASYEPLALLLALPLLYRIFPRSVAPPPSTIQPSHKLNTYLSPEAFALAERQCTLCLEPRGDNSGSVAVTECGHVFCWGCLGGLDKPECPLCRQSLRMERLIAAYNL